MNSRDPSLDTRRLIGLTLLLSPGMLLTTLELFDKYPGSNGSSLTSEK